MLNRRKKLKKSNLILTFLILIFFINNNIQVFAAPLIQGMNHQEEYEGLLAFGFLELTTLEVPDIDKVMKMVEPSIVRIETGDYIGSGTIINMEKERIILASSSHLLQYGDAVEVVFYEGTQITGNLIGNSKQYDVGFVEVLVADIPYPLISEIRYAPLQYDSMEDITYGSHMCLVGSADGVATNRESGTVLDPSIYFSEFNSFMIKSYCRGKSGMSGCGTFDSFGNYIGLLTGGLEEETASLPLSIIIDEYRIIVGESPNY